MILPHRRFKFITIQIQSRKIIIYMKIIFSYYFPPGSNIWRFLTSDSDSSSKTVYIATWIGLESQKLVEITQMEILVKLRGGFSKKSALMCV